ncbi:DUF7882 family protein [Microbacterium sp. 22195]|uniref:DUF7882 family protein n=1 Tax=Microbacterium sp. 22195 TaxID=3453891 RepID=UPI003F828E9D
MGTMYYGASGFPVHIKDRALAHLQVVVTTKLRRGESFTVSWSHHDDEPPGRSSIWLHPAVPLRFVFEDFEVPELSRQYLAGLANSANSSGDIHLAKGEMGRCLCASRPRESELHLSRT